MVLASVEYQASRKNKPKGSPLGMDGKPLTCEVHPSILSEWSSSWNIFGKPLITTFCPRCSELTQV